MWCGKTIGRRAINSLRNIARHQRSRLAFTTQQVTFDSDVTIRFEHRPEESQTSRDMLLSAAGFDGEPECPSALEAFQKILRVSRGLPLRLALIGGHVWKTADLYTNMNREEAWKIFQWGEAEDASIEERTSCSDHFHTWTKGTLNGVSTSISSLFVFSGMLRACPYVLSVDYGDCPSRKNEK